MVQQQSLFNTINKADCVEVNGTFFVRHFALDEGELHIDASDNGGPDLYISLEAIDQGVFSANDGTWSVMGFDALGSGDESTAHSLAFFILQMC